MTSSARNFIDFWNFQLNWNEHSGGRHCDWQKLPAILIDQAQDLLWSVGLTDPLSLEETLVYASVKPGPAEANLKRWLGSFLSKQPSFRVKIRDRSVRAAGIWCHACKTQVTTCHQCGTVFERAAEKGIDTAIVTDLLSLAWEKAYDVAILVTSDADFIPAVERIQERGLKVINATWEGHGYDLARVCWASFKLDTVVPLLSRS